MPKTAALKPAPSARTSVMKKAPTLTAAQRRRKIGALCDEVSSFWKGKPETGGVTRLLKDRAGRA